MTTALASRRRTIAGRLYLVGSLALVSVLGLAAVSIYFAAMTRRAADHLYEGGLVRAVEAGEIELLLERHRRVIEAAPLEADRAQIARDKTTAEAVIARVERLVGGVDATLARDVETTFDELAELGREVMRQAELNAQDRAQATLVRYVECAQKLQGLIRRHGQQRLAEANREAQALADRARLLVNAVAGIALLAGLLIGPVALVVLRRTVLRLEGVTQAMRRLASSDTDISIEAGPRGDEIGEMAEAVSVFRANAVQLLEHQHRLEQLNRWLDIALNNMARGLSMFDSERRLLVCNAAYQRMYRLPDALTRPGTSFTAILEQRRTLVAAVDDRADEGSAAVVPALESLASGREEGLLRQRLIDGRIIEVSVKPLPWGGWVAMHEDVTQRYEAAERITRLACQDTLTGLANRLSFRESLETAVAGLASGQAFALLAIDLDRFKEVNDSHGHPVGDALLTAVGRRLGELVRRGDIVARLGGDEFAIIQKGVMRAGDAEALARRIIEALHRPFELQGHRIEIGGTLGVALAPEHGTDAAELLRNADLALYRAKGERRGTCRFYAPEMQGRLRARRTLEGDLGQAVARGELELHYQPIISLAGGRVTGAEALLRWRHPVRGMVSPGEFIPIAEETGLIRGIGAWAFGEACRAAARLGDGLRVAVNLSVAQFSGPDLADIAAGALAESGIGADRIELEVTETLLLGDDPATLALLHRLRELGLAIALDDFGTGYSSLSHLRSFPFDKIKIDQTFVRDLPQRRNCEAIVGAVARLASSLGMTTVAEGVETLEHLARVEAAGCDAVQGYLFSRPVPEARLGEVIGEINSRLASRAQAA